MKRFLKYIFVVAVVASLWAAIWNSSAVNIIAQEDDFLFPPDTTLVSDSGSTDLPYPFKDEEGIPVDNPEKNSPLYLKKPSNISSSIEYNPETNEYEFSEKVGDMNYRNPSSMTIEEYKEYDYDRAVRNYWKLRVKGENFSQQKALIPKLHIGGEVFNRIFGSSTIDIRPQGSAELIFGMNISKIDNPQLSERLRKTWTFDFQEKIQMNVTGQIGDKLKLATNYNTEASFDFENKMNLAYEGKEDEIIQKVEAGDVTLPLTGSLITGSQSLFGLKTELQFGKLTATSVFSQQKGKTSVIEVEGGAQTNYFEVNSDEYEANKHFFLSHYFKDHYNQALAGLPIIESEINITKVEVWVTNKTANYEDSRNVLAFMDLGEAGDNIYSTSLLGNSGSASSYPTNNTNAIYSAVVDAYPGVRDFNNITTALAPLVSQNFVAAQDYEKIESARMLSISEYKLNERLGFISLNSALNADEILAVAYEYTTRDGSIKRVGEFSNEISAPTTVVVKLLKGTSLTPRLPTWDLMMKNVYALGAYQIDRTEFYLNIFYNDPKTGRPINYIPEEKVFSDREPILQLLNLDNLNMQLEAFPDGIFDFIENYTINPSNGRIYFPVLEPFGEDLEAVFGPTNAEIASNYIFNELYDSTQSLARQIAEKNKFIMKGSYKSAGGSDIALNALNVPKGSVVVTAAGRQLVEDVDFTVDYTLGRVKIINQGLLESGTPIKISLESNSLFSIQSKTLLGTHLDYKINKDFSIGGTILNLTERPLTQKVSIGDEPISNTIWGLDGTYRTEAPWLTKLVDKLPFLETKEASSITMNAEFADLIPGHSRAIQKEGVAYIDDFEGSKTSLDIKAVSAWKLASTPQGQHGLFIGGDKLNSLEYGFNRARLSWYVVDPILVRGETNTPENITDEDRYDLFVREVFEDEIFENKETLNGMPTNIPVLNLAFSPSMKGPYNYNYTGIDSAGHLLDPQDNWGGIMRKIETNDFEAANIEYIEFWVMDPFSDPDGDGPKQPINTTGGNLYFNLGNISEDILRDGRKTFENGLPTSEVVELVDTTIWGRVPRKQSMVTAFDNQESSRPFQDVGYDGLSNTDENSFFSDYLENVKSLYNTNSPAYLDAVKDPSNDDFHYFRGSGTDDIDYESGNTYRDILRRYDKYNGLEGNSPTSDQALAFGNDFPSQGTNLPDIEDINRDNNLSESESYFQYKVPMYPGMEIGDGYITDRIEAKVSLADDEDGVVTWYQFKIPLLNPDTTVGNILDFKSIRFVRLLLNGFTEDVVLRFATLDLVRGEWRKYRYAIREPGEWNPETGDLPSGTFDVSAVNIEENSKKEPVNYVLPPDIERVIDPSNPAMIQMNEQSILLKVTDLIDGDARAAFKNVSLDVRQYKKLQMEVHAEALIDDMLKDGDVRVFIRMGSDYKQNYYEYEIPLVITPPDSYDKDSPDDRAIVWPASNRFDFEFSILQTIKQKRNDQARDVSNPLVTPGGYMEMWDGGNRVVINGNPNLSDIRTIMIGVRNPKAANNPHNDDAQTKAVEIWLNELRLTDFDEEGGWAANARISARLADFGTLNISGNTSKRGFGSIEKKVNERNKEDVYAYDISSNLDLGKFFPEKARISIPMYVGYSESFVNPQYNPLDQDIPLEVALADAPTRHDRDSIKNAAQDYLKRKSINFTNVKVNSASPKPQIYSPSNFGLNAGYNTQESRDISTIHNFEKKVNGGLMYNYNANPKQIEPFKNANSKFMKSPWMRIVKDINFNFIPNQLSFRTDLNRMYKESKLRNISAADVDINIPMTIRKDFGWDRVYTLKYDITKALKFDFNATNIARLDEPQGRVYKDIDEYYDPYRDSITRKIWWDSIGENAKHFGRNTNYKQTINLSYNVPLNKIPLFSWMTATVRYRADYEWVAGPLSKELIGLGNIISNSNSTQLNGQMNFLTLYNKVPYLKKINQDSRKRGGTTPPKPKTEKVRWPEEKGERKKIILKEGQPKVLSHKLGTDDVQVKVYDDKGKPINGEVKILTDDKVSFTADKDYDEATVEILGTKEIKETIFQKILAQTCQILMGVKNLNISQSTTNGTRLPGYAYDTKFIGLNKGAPGLPYVFGYTIDSFADYAASNGWLLWGSGLYEPFTTTHTNNVTVRSSIEPLQGMRIDLNANRNESENSQEYLRWDSDAKVWKKDNSTKGGNFSMTFNTVGTAFKRIGKDGDYSSEVYNLFKDDNRVVISNRRGDIHTLGSHPDDPDFVAGYGPTSREVLIPAFIAAYTNQSPNDVSLDLIPETYTMKDGKFRLNMMPNWRITYDGLKNIEFLKKYLKTITIGHAYRSTYSIGSYTSNTYYSEAIDPSQIFDLNYNRVPEYDVGSISISEQFSPLIDVDMTWKNSLITKAEFKKSRNLALSFANNWMTETSSTEYIFGTGYRIKDVPLQINKVVHKSDLNLRADLSVRNNLTVIRKLEEGLDELTAGQSVITIKVSADYVLSDRFNLKIFYDRVVNKPKISLTYPRANTSFGISVRFTLAQN